MPPKLERHRELLTLAAILAVGVLLRLYNLGEWPLEQDELYTLRDARDLGGSVRPLYFWLQAGLLELHEPTEAYLRLPAAVFGICGIGATYLLGRKLFGVAAGLVAAALVALSPWHLYLSQFARYWTLVFFLSAIFYLLLSAAMERDSTALYVATAAAFVLGVLTHPAFLLPLPGLALAFLYRPDARIRIERWWKRGAMGLWLPLLAAGILGVVTLAGSGTLEMLFTQGGRGWAATLRILPALVQWLTPVVATAGIFAVAVLLIRGGGRDRQWAVLGAGAILSSVGAVVVGSLVRNAYVVYTLPVLPLVFVLTAGGIVRAAGAAESSMPRYLIAGTTALLLAATAPGVVSHLSNGTRFDVRPAYREIQRTAPERLVVGTGRILQEHYAPGLRFDGIPWSRGGLDSLLAAEEPGFWLIATLRRYGPSAMPSGVLPWLERNCRMRLATQEPRLDYREYRVELHWCEGGTKNAAAAPPPRTQGPLQTGDRTS